MKSFGRPSFFRCFDLMLSMSNPGLKLSRWVVDGVEIERERHSFTGPKHGLAIEICTLTRPGRRGWTLMVTKEYWWAGEENRALKNLRWAKPVSGQRADILAWMKVQESALDKKLSPSRLGGSSTKRDAMNADGEFEIAAVDLEMSGRDPDPGRE